LCLPTASASFRTTTFSTGVGGGEERSVVDAAEERQLLALTGDNGATMKPSTPLAKIHAAMQIVVFFIRVRGKR
jgi:hypothetical protein